MLPSEDASGLANIENSLYKDNLKAPNWIYGNITEEQYKQYLFKITTQYNLTSCPLETPFINVEDGSCFACDGTYSLGERKCVACPEGQHYDSKSNQCIDNPPECADNEKWNAELSKCEEVIC